MKLEKKQLMMIGIVALVIFLIYWLFFRKKDTKKESGYLQYGDIDAETGYGPEYGAFQSYGYESSFLNCKSDEMESTCDWSSFDGNKVVVTTYRCCVKKPKLVVKPSESGYNTNRCKDKDGNAVTPCPPNIRPEDVIGVRTIK